MYFSRHLLLLIFGATCSYSKETYPIAPQTGPSCGFFANVPALTFATGVDIGDSKQFIRPIYQLHRGDASFGRSFSKEKFYELFSIPYLSYEIRHDDLPLAELKSLLVKKIAETFDPALAQGKVYSMRVIGAFGGPHNALLLGKEGELYVVHDPYPGGIKRFTRDELAKWILVPTSATRDEPNKRYITQYLKVTLPKRHRAPWKKITDLPVDVSIEWNEIEREQLRKAFHPDPSKPADESLEARIARFPLLDFATLAPKSKGKPHLNALDENMEPMKLSGVIYLAKFSLSVWQMNQRDQLPVLFLQGRPHVLSAYRPENGPADEAATLEFFDGEKTLKLTVKKALTEFKSGGCHFATTTIPCRRK